MLNLTLINTTHLLQVAVKLSSHDVKVKSAIMLMSDPCVAAKVNKVPTWGATPLPQRVNSSTPISARKPLKPVVSPDIKVSSLFPFKY